MPSVCTDSVTFKLGQVDLIQSLDFFFWASEYPKMSQQGAGGKRKHVMLLIPKKLEIIIRPESGEHQTEIMVSCNIGSSTKTQRNRQTRYNHL
jgi:hypothetical protein